MATVATHGLRPISHTTPRRVPKKYMRSRTWQIYKALEWLQAIGMRPRPRGVRKSVRVRTTTAPGKNKLGVATVPQPKSLYFGFLSSGLVGPWDACKCPPCMWLPPQGIAPPHGPRSPPGRDSALPTFEPRMQPRIRDCGKCRAMRFHFENKLVSCRRPLHLVRQCDASSGER